MPRNALCLLSRLSLHVLAAALVLLAVPAVSWAADGSKFIAQTGSTALQPGQSGTVSVTMRNTGTTTWTAAAGYKLGSENPQDNVTWGKNRIHLAPGDTIKPGEEKTFTFSVTAPSAAGWYNLQWRMLREGVAWFGDLSANRIVQVLGAWDISAFVAQTGSTALQPGQSGTVSVTMRNTGTTTWTAAAGYKLGSENPRDNVTWGTNRIQLAPGDAIKPGEQKTFTFTVRAPSAAGSYNLQWRMLREGVAWFGALSANRTVQVLASAGGGYRTDYEYACSWKRGATTGSASLRLDTSGPSGLQGTLTTAQTNGAVEKKPFVLSNPSHPQAGATTWLYHQTEDNVRCELHLLDSGTELVWKNCSNGLYQQCVAMTQDVRSAMATAACSCGSLSGMALMECTRACLVGGIEQGPLEDFNAAARARCMQDLVSIVKCLVIWARSEPGMEVCENASGAVEELCWGWVNFGRDQTAGGSCSSSMECAGGSFCVMVKGGRWTCGSMRN